MIYVCSLRKGISIINELTSSDFEILMKEIPRSDITTSKDMEKLKESLGLDDNSWNLLVQSVAHIFKVSLKFIFKPTALQKQLEDDSKLDSEKAKEFVKQWSLYTKRDFGDLENRWKLNDVAWQLNVQTASSAQNKEATPTARLQFNMAKPKSELEQNLTLELNCEELVQLYSALENMQNKLDTLSLH